MSEVVQFCILTSGAHIIVYIDSDGVVSYSPGPEDSKMYRHFIVRLKIEEL